MFGGPDVFKLEDPTYVRFLQTKAERIEAPKKSSKFWKRSHTRFVLSKYVENKSMNEVTIYPKKLKLLAIAISLLFVILGFYFVQNRVEIELPVEVVIITSYIGIPFCGLGLVYVIYRLLVPKPAVVISDEGLFDNASAVGAGMLRWEEIADVFTYDYMGQRWLGIIPVNEAVVLSRQSPLRRVMAKMNKGITEAPFNIPQSVLPISIDELLSKVEERRRHPRVGRS